MEMNKEKICIAKMCIREIYSFFCVTLRHFQFSCIFFFFWRIIIVFPHARFTQTYNNSYFSFFFSSFVIIEMQCKLCFTLSTWTNAKYVRWLVSPFWFSCVQKYWPHFVFLSPTEQWLIFLNARWITIVMNKRDNQLDRKYWKQRSDVNKKKTTVELQSFDWN